MNLINKFKNWIRHLLGTNRGKVVTWIDDDYVYVGFKCDCCGKIDEKSIDKIEKEMIWKT